MRRLFLFFTKINDFKAHVINLFCIFALYKNHSCRFDLKILVIYLTEKASFVVCTQLLELFVLYQFKMKIQELEKRFHGTGEVKGFRFLQIKKSVAAYLYEVETDGQIHYEIIKRSISAVCIDFEKKIFSETDFKEIYPKSTKFGTDAFTSKNKDDAIKKFYEYSGELLLKEINKPIDKPQEKNLNKPHYPYREVGYL